MLICTLEGPNTYWNMQAEMFPQEYDQVGHSKRALGQLSHLKIGEIDPEDVAEIQTCETWTQEAILIRKQQVTYNTMIFTFQFVDEFELQLVPG